MKLLLLGNIALLIQLAKLVELLRGYLENLHSAKQELSIAFTNETFARLVQVSLQLTVSVI